MSLTSLEKKVNFDNLNLLGNFTPDLFGDATADSNSSELVKSEISKIKGNAPTNLDSLEEIANAIANDSFYYQTANNTFVDKVNNQTIGGQKTFTSDVVISGVGRQLTAPTIILGSSNIDNRFLRREANINENVSGVKTFQSNTIFQGKVQANTISNQANTTDILQYDSTNVNQTNVFTNQTNVNTNVKINDFQTITNQTSRRCKLMLSATNRLTKNGSTYTPTDDINRRLFVVESFVHSLDPTWFSKVNNLYSENSVNGSTTIPDTNIT
jgi:hypothetical protein